ncbi:MAG TPA: septum formation initiator family protein [Stellaceae bacterium]|nr:septum formation initiator family protein [Stellaceae bacterium]
MRRRAPAIAWPLIGIAVTAYFAYHAWMGERGLRAGREIAQQLFLAKQNLAATEAERDALAHKVAGLDPAHVDPDLLDQQIRSTLDLVAPNEIIILQSGQAP